MSNQDIKSKSNSNRRNFLKQGMAGLAGAAFLPTALASENEPGGGEKKAKIVRKVFGKTGVKTPVLSVGVSYNAQLTGAILDAGLNHLVTSDYYRKGKDEEAIGAVIKDRARDSIIISTNFYAAHLQDVRTRNYRPGTTAEPLQKAFEGSLKRLGTDYVDFYYLGGVSGKKAALYEPFLEQLRKYKKQGRARYLGVSCHMNEPEIIRAAADSGVYDVVMTAYNFKQAHLPEMKKAIHYAAGKGLGICAMKTQAGAYWDREKKHPIDNHAALRWALADPNVATICTGFMTFEHMKKAMAVMEDLTFSKEDQKKLHLAANNTNLPGLYCSQCGHCLEQCPYPVDIPSAMRSYMYAYGYQSPRTAWETMQSLENSSFPCSGCGSCKVKCTMGFDVKEKLMDIARIKDIPEEFMA